MQVHVEVLAGLSPNGITSYPLKMPTLIEVSRASLECNSMEDNVCISVVGVIEEQKIPKRKFYLSSWRHIIYYYIF